MSQPAYQPTKPNPYAGTWKDRTGHELPTTTQQRRVALLSYDGARHCNAESVTFLAVAGLLPEANGQRWSSRPCLWHEGAQIAGGLCNHAMGRWKLQA